MDVRFFLTERTRYIRYFYEYAAKPFSETMRKIEAEEAPFDERSHDEDGEPTFLDELEKAKTALEILGRSCVSMLSASLQLYFKTWETELGIKYREGEKEKVFKKGFLKGYRTCFGQVLEIPWDHCPANFELLEQVILARNRDQHPEDITSMRVVHSVADRNKYSRPFFASDIEINIYAGTPINPWTAPRVHVSRDALFTAIEEVEKLVDWLEGQFLEARYGG